jgi:hypothetical protein
LPRYEAYWKMENRLFHCYYILKLKYHTGFSLKLPGHAMSNLMG